MKPATKPEPTPGQHLILVKVTLPTFGAPKYEYSRYNADTGKLEDVTRLTVRSGNQIAWWVELYDAGQGRSSYPPYQIEFADAKLLGSRSISVPSGGHSGFHHVLLPFSRPFKYTLSVAGLNQPDDPDIQVEPLSGSREKNTGTPRVISWSYDKPMPTISCKDDSILCIGDGTQGNPFRLEAKSMVVWEYVSAMNNSDFEVDFTRNGHFLQTPVMEENPLRSTQNAGSKTSRTDEYAVQNVGSAQFEDWAFNYHPRNGEKDGVAVWLRIE